MALARLDVPSVMLYGGSIAPGRFQGRDVTISDVFEAVGAHAPGKMTDEELRRARARRQPGRRRVRRPVHRQHDGDGLRGAWASRPMARRWSRPQDADQGRGRPTRPGRLVDGRAARAACARATSSPRRRWRTRSPRSRASGGSTNGVLHLLAVATRGGRRARHRRLRPHQRAHAAAVRPQARRALRRRRPLRGGRRRRSCSSACSEAGLLHEDALTVTGQTIGELADDGQRDRRPAGRAAARRPAQAHRRPGDPARQPRPRGLRRQARRPRAPPPRGPGARLRGRGGRDGRRHGAADQGRRRRRHPQRGPGRRPGHARDARRHRRRSSARGWARTSRCSPTGASPAPRTASWPATSRPRPSRGGPIAAVRDGDTITIDVDARRLDVALSDDEIAARVAAYEPPANADAHRRAGQVRRARRQRLRGRRHAGAAGAVARRTGVDRARRAAPAASCAPTRSPGSSRGTPRAAR